MWHQMLYHAEVQPDPQTVNIDMVLFVQWSVNCVGKGHLFLLSLSPGLLSFHVVVQERTDLLSCQSAPGYTAHSL